MKKVTKEWFCDVCERQANSETKVVQVIFTTEQTEGRSRSPHLSLGDLDLCSACNDKLLEGNYIWAHGAQGHNTYYFKKEK